MTHQKLMAIFFLVLLAGNECARIEAGVNMYEASIHRHHNEQIREEEAANSKTEWGVLPNYGRTVCHKDADDTAVRERYAHKVAKLQKQLEDVAKDAQPGMIKILSQSRVAYRMRELRQRMAAIAKCTEETKDRPTLHDMIKDPETGVAAMLKLFANKIVIILEKSELVDWKPKPEIGCTMELRVPRSIDSSQTVETAVQEAMYGKSCQIDAYKSSLSQYSKKGLAYFEAKIVGFMKRAQATSKEEALDAELDEDLQDKEPTLEDVQIEAGEASLLQQHRTMDAESEEIIEVFAIFFGILAMMVIGELVVGSASSSSWKGLNGGMGGVTASGEYVFFR